MDGSQRYFLYVVRGLDGVDSSIMEYRRTILCFIQKRIKLGRGISHVYTLVCARIEHNIALARDRLISNFPTSILTPCIKVYHRIDVYRISLSTGLQEAVNTINDLSSLQLLLDLTAYLCRIQRQNNPASQVMDLEISAIARTKNTHHLHPSPLVCDI